MTDKYDNIDFSEHFVYDETSPTFLRWKSPFRKGRSGKPVRRENNGIAGCITKDGVPSVNLGKSLYTIKFIIWTLFYGPLNGKDIRNIDGDTSNLRIDNLEEWKEVSYDKKYGEWLNEYFVYDETSPSCLRWKVQSARGSNVKAGDVAGSLDARDGYYRIHGLGSHFKAHKIVWALFHPEDVQDGYFVDHFDRNRANNKISNLRLVNQKLSARNKGMHRNNKTGVTGVAFHDRYQPSGEYFSKYYVTIRSLEGKKVSRSFSVQKYGDTLAFELACKWRQDMIDQMNAEGGGYSPDHGIPNNEVVQQLH